MLYYFTYYGFKEADIIGPGDVFANPSYAFEWVYESLFKFGYCTFSLAAYWEYDFFWFYCRGSLIFLVYKP